MVQLMETETVLPVEPGGVLPKKIENTMNEGDPTRLFKYIDPEFLNCTPDDKSKIADQYMFEEQYDIKDERDNELLDDFDEVPEAKPMLQPREYQYELYQKAIDENVIAVLDTGSGKTLIAVMLIKYMFNKEREERLTRRKAKLTFFLVDRVPLVFQQASVISANCDAVVQQMCGQMDVDNWSEKKWRIIFEESDVCVMTAQIFLDTLRHGFIHMDEVNLLIFDECHHCTKRHPYNLIMREFYDRCPVADRPKVFGMTASPMHGKTDVQYSVFQLEKNLDAKVYTATNLDQLLKSVNKPGEISMEYRPSPEYQETPLTKKIREKIGTIERYKRCFDVTNNILYHLGPWCCDRLWKYLLEEMDNRVKIDTEDLAKDRLMDEDRALKEAYELSIITNPGFPNFRDEKLFTHKVTQLMRILSVYAGQPNFCGIVFVERRHTAVALNNLIQAYTPFQDKIKSSILIGHGSTDDGDVQMRFKEQNRVIQRFRDAELNLMIATNVAEEGLDIQPCNVVIRFDFFNTLIGYIQSRGRARMPNSKYIILVEESNTTQANKLSEFRGIERDLREFCRTMPEDRNMALKFANNLYDNDTDDYLDSDLDDEDDFAERIYMIPSTGAVITMHSAVALVHRYCGSLPSDSFCILQPVFELTPVAEGYTCTVRLPSNAAIREATSTTTRSKNRAKRLAALDICEKLHRVGAFNDHLLPNNPKREMLGEMAPQVDENGQIIGSRRRRFIYEKRTPRFWEREEEKEPEEELERNEAAITTVPDQKLENKEHPGNGVTVEGVLKPPVGTETGPQDAMETIANLQVTKTINDDTDVENKNADGKINDVDAVSEKPRDDLMYLQFIPKVESNQVQHENNRQRVNAGENETNEIKDNVQTAAMEEEKDGVNEQDQQEDEDIGPGPHNVWFNVIDVDLSEGAFDGIPVRQMAFLTWKEFLKLPQFQLYFRGKPFNIRVHPFTDAVSLDKEDIELLSKFTLSICSAINNKEYKCPIKDFPYFLAPLVHTNGSKKAEVATVNDIDWEEINRVSNTMSLSIDLADIEASLRDKIIVDYTDSFRRYFVHSVCLDMNPFSPIPTDMKMREKGHENFAHYYKETFKKEVTDEKQPLVRVRRVNKVMNYLMPITPAAPVEKGRVATYLIPEFCQIYSVSASVFQSAMLIPSIMTRVDSFLLAREASVRYDIPASDDLMLEAYTCPSASMAMDYERLETLGDSLLKFIATIRLYINFPFSNEGELHCLRIRVICNRALYRAAKRLKIFRYVTSHTFNRRYWRPHHFVASSDTPDTLKETRTHMLSDKTLADIVEASLGAAYLTSGLEGGLHCAIQMQIPFDEVKTWSDFLPAYLASKDKVPARAEIKALRSLSIFKVQEITGYVFKTPLLVVEAMTHASLPNSTAPCYQRLEFLGDAILDFLVIRYLYAKYPEASPGLITDLKDSCVNNHVLGIICIELELHTQIIHYSGRLVRAIEEFHNEVQQIKDKGEAIGEYWTDLTVPKVLSDVVESMLGAVFVDAGFNLDPVEAMFERWMIPFYDKHVTPELIKVHPLNKFTTSLQRMGCESFMLRNHTTASTGPHSQKCVIFLHDKPLATGAADNIKAARRNAATKALLRLEEEPDLLERVCDCGIVKRKRDMSEEDEEEEE